MAYCTAQDVIETCTWPGFGRLSATAQSRFIDAASDKVDSACGRKFGFTQQSETESFDGRGQSELWLSLRPVVTVASVTIDGDPIDNTDGTAWTLDGATGRLIRGAGREDPRFALRWPHGDGNIVVQYWGGYAAIPANVILATAYAVKYLFDQGKVSGAYSQETIGSYTRSIRQVPLTAGLPDHIIGLLQPYMQDVAFV
jgi:hypothetical protein